MKWNPLLVMALLWMASCNSKRSGPLFSTNNLPATQYTIDVNNDTLLRTTGGAWLKIEKGSFSAPNGKAVLEIKEAFSPSAMIKAGLGTQSNGQPLMSGGMLYIGAAPGQDVQFKKPVTVAVPADFLQKNMQLYKGRPGPDGSLNWTEPQALPPNPQLTAIEKGAVLFQQKCAPCHGIGKQGTGPDLAHVMATPNFYSEGGSTQRHHFRKTFRWDNELKDTTGDGYSHTWTDTYVCNLITLFGNKEVDLSDDYRRNEKDWDMVYRYIQNESDNRELNLPPHYWLHASTDSCDMYNRIKWQLENRKEAEMNKKRELEANLRDKPMVDANNRPDTAPRPQNNTGFPAVPPPGFTDKVEQPWYQSQYYQFTIESFGWFNIDILLKGVDGVEDSRLLVRITGSYTQRVQVYLVIPSKKILLPGGPAETGDNTYAFDNKNGAIPLPQGVKAWILAVTESTAGMAYSIEAFTIKASQTINISLQPVTPEAFNKAVELLDAEGLNIKAQVDKEAEAIRNTEKTIAQLEMELKKAENMKPKGCDCDCGSLPAPPAPEAHVVKTAAPANEVAGVNRTLLSVPARQRLANN